MGRIEVMMPRCADYRAMCGRQWEWLRLPKSLASKECEVIQSLSGASPSWCRARMALLGCSATRRWWAKFTHCGRPSGDWRQYLSISLRCSRPTHHCETMRLARSHTTPTSPPRHGPPAASHTMSLLQYPVTGQRRTGPALLHLHLSALRCGQLLRRGKHPTANISANVRPAPNSHSPLHSAGTSPIHPKKSSSTPR